MSDYQKVEINKSEEAQPFSEADLAKIKEDAPAVEETVQEAESPDWLPEKFSSPEDLAKAYEELQAKMSSGESPETEEPAEESGDNRDFSKFTEEFAESGDLSEKSVSEIQSWGIPKEMIDGYIEGQKAVQQATFNSIYAETGGEDGYKEMLEWASTELAEGDQEAFNKIVMEGSKNDMMFAVRSLANRWKAGGGQTKPLVQGSTSSSGASGGFRSLAELTNAMKDPKYQKDPAYRQDIENRLKVSNIL